MKRSNEDYNQGKRLRTGLDSEAAVILESHEPEQQTAVLAVNRGNSIVMYSVPSGKYLQSFGDGEFTLKFDKCVFSPDGTRLATSVLANCNCCRVLILDAETGEELVSWIAHTNLISAISFSPDGSRIASCSWDHLVKIWDSFTGVELNSLVGHSHWIPEIAFSPDGSMIVTGSLDKTVKIWNVATGVEMLTFRGHAAQVSSVAFHPDGQSVASGSHDGTTKIWDVTTGREKMELKNSNHGKILFTPDGSRLVMSNVYTGDLGIIVWDVTSGGQVLAIVTQQKEVAPFFRPTHISISTDGRWIAGSYGQSMIKVWDLCSGEEITSIEVSMSHKMSLSFCPEESLQLW